MAFEFLEFKHNKANTIKEGYMLKRPVGRWLNHSYKKRSFKLYDNNKLEYTKISSNEIKGAFDLDLIKKICKTSNKKEFEIVTQNNMWSFLCESEQERNEWFDAIHKISIEKHKNYINSNSMELPWTIINKHQQKQNEDIECIIDEIQSLFKFGFQPTKKIQCKVEEKESISNFETNNPSIKFYKKYVVKSQTDIIALNIFLFANDRWSKCDLHSSIPQQIYSKSPLMNNITYTANTAKALTIGTVGVVGGAVIGALAGTLYIPYGIYNLGDETNDDWQPQYRGEEELCIIFLPILGMATGIAMGIHVATETYKNAANDWTNYHKNYENNKKLNCNI